MDRFESALRDMLGRHDLVDADVDRAGDGPRPTFVVSVPASRPVSALAELLLDASTFTLARFYDDMPGKFAAKVAKLGVVRVCFEEIPGGEGDGDLPSSLTGALEAVPA